MLKTTAELVGNKQTRKLGQCRAPCIPADRGHERYGAPTRPRLIILPLSHPTPPGSCTHPVESPPRLSPIGHPPSPGMGGTAWEVGRAHRARRVEHRPVDQRMAKSWNQDRDRSHFPPSESKSRRNPKLQRHTTEQDLTFPLYVRSLLWHLTMTSLLPPMSHRLPRPTLAPSGYHKASIKECSSTPE